MSLSCGSPPPRIPGPGRGRGSATQVLVGKSRRGLRGPRDRPSPHPPRAPPEPPSGSAHAHGSLLSLSEEAGGLRLLVPPLYVYPERTTLGKRLDLLARCCVMTSHSPPYGNKQCLVPRAFSLFSTQKEFFRRGAAEDILPLQNRSRLCFPGESLRPQNKESLATSSSEGSPQPTATGSPTSPPTLTGADVRPVKRTGSRACCAQLSGLRAAWPGNLVEGKPSPP